VNITPNPGTLQPGGAGVQQPAGRAEGGALLPGLQAEAADLGAAQQSNLLFTPTPFYLHIHKNSIELHYVEDKFSYISIFQFVNYIFTILPDGSTLKGSHAARQRAGDKNTLAFYIAEKGMEFAQIFPSNALVLLQLLS
jgi:hypothetical protein